MYKSDHQIVFASFADMRRQSQAKSRLLLNKRHVPNFKAMNPTRWSNFAEYTNFHYNHHNLVRYKDLTPTLTNMNSLWTIIKPMILSASRKEIPHIWITPIQKAKQLYDTPDSLVASKKVGSILLIFKQRLIQQNLWPIDIVWSQCVTNLNKIIVKMKLTPCTFPTSLNIYNVVSVKSSIKDIYRSLVTLAKNDIMKLKETAIQQLVDKRCDDLLHDTSKMIDSILNRNKHSIVLDHLLIYNNDTNDKRFTVEPNEIKNAVIDHF